MTSYECIKHIGSHVNRNNMSLSELIVFANDSVPSRIVQLFLHSKFSKQKEISDKEIKRIRKNVSNLDISVYVHSPYNINLSNPDNKYFLNILIKELEQSNVMGFKGVVVHCGKGLKLSVPKATEIMLESIKYVLENSKCSIPLLLETPVGCGTEICWEIETFIDFIQLFDTTYPTLKNRLKVCIDTCHVFSAGYNPIGYIKYFDQECPNKIELIHFNDSKRKQGDRVDRHAFYGQGEIGIVEMNKVADWCKKNNIDAIVE